MYRLTTMVLDETIEIEISESEYLTAVRAKECLLEALEIEEKFDLVLRNYEEFELELLRIALQGVMHSNWDWSLLVGAIQTLNQRLVNMLTACRLYIDQTSHNLSTIYGAKSPQLTKVLSQASEEYDSRLGYRVLETLRNYVQHRGLPVHGISTPMVWVDNTKDTRKHLRYTADPVVSIQKLLEDSKLKPSILDELRSLGDSVPLKPLIREYLVGLGQVHSTIRAEMASDLRTWETVIEGLIDRYSAAAEGNVLGLGIVKMDGVEWTLRVPLFRDFIDRRRELMDRNYRTSHFSTAVVANY